MNDHYPACPTAYFLHRTRSRTPHGTQHTPCQRITSEPGQQFPVARINWQMRHALHNVRRITRKMLPLTEQGHRFIAGLQRHPNHFRAFGDKDAPLRVNAVAQLGFGQGAEHFHSGMLQRGDFDNGHNVDFFE